MTTSSTNTKKSQTQCTCRLENEDPDFSMFKTALPGTKFVAFIHSCHKCGKYRMSLKMSGPMYDRSTKNGDGTY